MKPEPLPRSFKERYLNLLPLLDQAKHELSEIVEGHLRMIGRKYLARVRLVDARIKDFDSLQEKVARKGWKTAEIWDNVEDLVGLRIVCHNLEDIERITQQLLKDGRLQLKGEVQDRRDPSGYRSRQFNVIYGIKISEKVQPHLLVCEVQIQTMLQDAWASLTHDDIYKDEASVPEDVKKLSTRLSELLVVADGIAQDIRDRLSAPATVSRAAKRDEPEVTRTGLQLLFQARFSKDIPEYLAAYAIKRCRELGLYRLDGLEDVLKDARLFEQLDEEHCRRFPFGLSEEDFFQFALTAAVRGPAAALKEAKKRFQRELEEISQIAPHEETPLPETVEELLQELTPTTKDEIVDLPVLIHRLAQRFDVRSECAICGADIVDEDELAEAILDHYKSDNDEVRRQLNRAIVDSGIELGGWDHPSLCSYHADLMTK